MRFEDTLNKLHALDRECGLLSEVTALLSWDQEVNLPRAGVEERAEQMALMEGLVHGRATSPEIDKLLRELGSTSENPRGDESLPALERDFCKVLRREYDRMAKLPPDFVREYARAQGISQAAWAEARKRNDFAAFAPHLQNMVDIMRRAAGYWGGSGAGVYDCLLDLYEPGVKADEISRLFKPLRERLSALIRQIAARPQPDTSFVEGEYDPDQQARYNHELMKRLGFPLDRGRLDVSAHPFTNGMGYNDIRITTRYAKNDPLSSIFSVIHESGHAFYELHIAPELRGSSLGQGVSMGIHESQSRLLENVVGRSRSFWEGQFPALKEFFPRQLGQVSLDAFYRAVNRVQPSLIRTEADEVSYSLHIILRFELERRIFAGELAVNDLPKAWEESMKEFLGLAPDTDAQGVLQDIHWSQGSFGYFPSYALGNLYGLQFWQKLRSDLPGADAAIAAGNFEPIHTWLADTIHCWGKRLDPPELLKKVTGQVLAPDAFLDYVETKYAGIYGL
ncbi:MAG: carboxypeptidase M32 [Treponema sp.]|jgi:carboxypeptidase Taq|nr:carboxypeptidase M32 [Treponema sp.]